MSRMNPKEFVPLHTQTTLHCLSVPLMDTNGKKDRPTSKVYLCNCIYTRFKVRS